MKLRVLIVGPVPPPFHGCSVATELLLRSAVRDQFELIHLDTSDRRSLDNLGTWDLGNIAVAIRTVWRAAVIGLTMRPSIIYLPISQNAAGFLRDAVLMWTARVTSGARIVVHLHGGKFQEFYSRSRLPMRALVASTMRAAHSGIVLGERLVDQLSPWIPRGSVAVIPNCTTVGPIRRKPPQRDVACRVLFLGNLLKFKGIVDVVAAVAEILPRHANLECVLAGSWTRDPMFHVSAEETRAECEAIIRASSRPGAFMHVGELDREEVESALASADLVVLPSYDEGLPLVLLEAMGAGLPVVASRGVGAIEEVVIEGTTGLLVTPGDRKAIGAAISMLVENASLRAEMGQAGAARCRAQYSPALWAARMVQAFKSTLSRRYPRTSAQARTVGGHD